MTPTVPTGASRGLIFPDQDITSAEEACQRAHHYTHLATTLIGHDGRRYDPRFGSRLCAALAQLAPAVKAGHPNMDQTEAP